MALLIRRPFRIDWERFAATLREEYADRLIDEAVERLDNGDVFEWHGKIGVNVRSDLGDDRSKLGAKNYWPTGDGQWEPFHCMCHELRTTGVCSHALAARMYSDWLEERDAAQSESKPSLSVPHSARRKGIANKLAERSNGVRK